MGQGTLAALLGVLNHVGARVLARAVFQTGRGAVWHVDAIVGTPTVPGGWRAEVWEYDPVTFVAGEVSSRALAAALDPGDAQVLQLGPFALTLPVLHAQLTWRRQPSRARYDSVALPWPATIFELNRPARPDRQAPQQYLIGDDCPSFFSYDQAFRAFFYGDFAGAPGHHVPSDTALIRMVPGKAWLERVLITPTHMDVIVRGRDVAGTRAELNGATYRADARVSDTGEVRIPLPDGLPDSSWLYLSRDRQWLDYRAIGEYKQDDLARAGIEVELPADPDTEIQALLSQGEGQQIEFKRQLPGDTVDSKRTVFKTVAAFANGTGGTIAFGIEKDEATVCGLDDIDVIRERDRLIQLTRSILTPAPAVETRQYDVNGKTILALQVDAGPDTPYGITPGSKNSPLEFYIRRGATTFPARPEEIRNAVLTRKPSSNADFHAAGSAQGQANS
jgi:hypothetical protein